MRWVDVEALLVERLPALLPGVDAVGTDTPSDLAGMVFVRITVAPGGTDDGLNDNVRVDVETFAPTREAAVTLGEDARQAMMRLAGTDTSSNGRALVDRVSTIVRPHWRDYRNPAIQRVVATYDVISRLQ